MDLFSYALEWASMLTRWLHVITGIAWIGASFYFIWLDNHLHPPTAPDLVHKGVSGELWAVHGGGFYNPQKYMVAPKQLPAELHWFKWEAYTTWLSGFALLGLVYHARASTYLIDAQVAALTPAQGIAISIGALVAGWVVYDGLCRSPLGRHELALGVVLFVLIVAAGWGLGRLLAPRAAYLHVGAMIGTMMVANVLMVIIPGQRRVVEAMKRGETPNPEDGRRGKQRSVHNNYLSLPVLFMMVSNHYAMTYTHPQAWLVLAVIMLAGVLIRHFFNLRHKGRTVWALPAAGVALLLALALWMAPRSGEARANGNLAVPSLDEVRVLMAQRCTSCHAAKPTYAGFAAPPAGVVLDSAAGLEGAAERVYRQVVELRAMPLGNLTGMTETERELVARWYRARLP